MAVVLAHASVRDAMVAAALAEGFDLAGVALASLGGDKASEELRERFSLWVEMGRAAEMAYLKRVNESGEMVRASLHAAFPWARSVLVCAMNYNADAPPSVDEAPEGSGWIARYAWSGVADATGLSHSAGSVPDASTVPAMAGAARVKGGAWSATAVPAAGVSGGVTAADYHDVLLERLRRVEQAVRGIAGDDVLLKAYVDTGPLVERHFAQAAGIGWTGKNACVLNQGMGSWLLLGVIVMGVEFSAEVAALPAADRCGSCTRCIDACPTDALVAPREMDAARCISYLTIEKKGEIAEDLRGLMGRQVFGCDICQDVCPWNRKAPVTGDAVMGARRDLINPSLEWLAEMGNREFRAAFDGSPLERTGRKRVQRNVAIAMGNSGDVRHLPRLKVWAGGEDAVLADAARWAVAQIAKRNGEEIPLASASIDE